ncbi:MAG: archease [Phycisphaerae bacterium]
MSSPPYEILDHTADMLLRIRGQDIRTLFANALAALYAVLGQLAAGPSVQPRLIRLTAGNREELLHDWLAEALYYAEVRHEVLRDVRFVELTDTALVAQAAGAALDMDRCAFDREIKAVTYHELAIRQEGDGLVATVVIDI